MKKLIFISIIFSFFGSLKAQNYLPTLEDNKTWDIETWDQFTWPPVFGYRLKTNGDSIINNVTYIKIDRYTLSLSNNVIPDGFYSLLREDTISKKIFRYNSNGDILIIDYNLNFGDTFIVHGFNPPQDQMIVDSIKTIQTIDGVYRRVTHLSFADTNYNYPSNRIYAFIEGIGSGQGLVRPFANEFEYTQTLHCVKRNDTIRSVGYNPKAQGYYNCSFTHPVGIEESKLGEVSFYPNPTNGLAQIKGKNIKQIEVYTISGKLVKSKLINSKSSYIDITNQPKGIYFVKILLDSGTTLTKKLIIN